MKQKYIMRAIEILCIISLIVTILSIQRTYAKYFEQVDTTYNTNIKRWLVRVNDKIVHEAQTLNEIMEPIIVENENINSNILVPGQTGYFVMDIDYTDVDLAFEYQFSISQLNETQLEDFEIYGYEIWDSVDGVDTMIEHQETKEIKGIIDPTTEANTAGEKKREIRVLFRWNDGEGSVMDNREDTQFRGENPNQSGNEETGTDENPSQSGNENNETSTTNARTILRYQATMTFTQYIQPEENDENNPDIEEQPTT